MASTPTQNLEQGFQIYDEDVVRLKEDGEDKIGYVTQLGWESDSDSEDSSDDDYDEDEDEDEEEEFEIKNEAGEGDEEGEEYEEEDYENDLQKNEVLITWLDGSESAHDANSIEVVDRALMPGDIVGWDLTKTPSSETKDKTRKDMQTGTVIKVHLLVDLKGINEPLTLNNIEANSIKPVDTTIYVEDTYVVKVGDFWLGQILAYYVDVKVKFEDGSICLVKNSSWEVLIPSEYSDDSIYEELDEDELKSQQYLPGIKVVAKAPIFKKCKYNKGKYHSSHKEGIIISALVKRVDIDWILCVSSVSSSKPNMECTIKEIKVLDCFINDKYQVGDRVLYSVDSQKRYGTLIKTSTTADVLWQDGSISTSLPTIDLVPIYNFVDDVFWPNDFVTLKDPLSKKVGYIKSMDYKDRTCIVGWFQSNKGENEVKEEEELLPVYLIKTHPEYDFTIGDCVISSQAYFENQKKTQWTGLIVDIHGGILTIYWNDDSISDILYDSVLKLTDELIDEFNMNGSIQDLSLNENINKTDSNNETLDESINQNGNKSLETNHISNKEESSESLSTFDILELEIPVLHSFYSEKDTKVLRKNNSFLVKEWELLKNHLPDGIYIRGYETDLDFYKILMIGPLNTPYEGFLFVFDLYLPTDYPSQAPKMNYVSRTNFKINPNLYVNGNICLSLLGTWSGKSETEIWNKESNILQLLLSVQGLILGTSKPYFNEAGYDKLRNTLQGEYNASLYNESVLLGCLESLVSLYHNPPIEFSGLIKSLCVKNAVQVLNHLQQFLMEKIMKGCNELIEGKKEGKKSSFCIENPSVGLKKALQPRIKELNEIQSCKQ